MMSDSTCCNRCCSLLSVYREVTPAVMSLITSSSALICTTSKVPYTKVIFCNHITQYAKTNLKNLVQPIPVQSNLVPRPHWSREKWPGINQLHMCKQFHCIQAMVPKLLALVKIFKLSMQAGVFQIVALSIKIRYKGITYPAVPSLGLHHDLINRANSLLAQEIWDASIAISTKNFCMLESQESS